MDVKTVVYIINMFFFVYMFLYSLAYFITTLFSSFSLDDFLVRRKYMGSTNLVNEFNYIPISIIVPAHNEELTIIESIESLLRLDYPMYEIVIVMMDQRIKH